MPEEIFHEQTQFTLMLSSFRTTIRLILFFLSLLEISLSSIHRREFSKENFYKKNTSLKILKSLISIRYYIVLMLIIFQCDKHFSKCCEVFLSSSLRISIYYENQHNRRWIFSQLRRSTKGRKYLECNFNSFGARKFFTSETEWERDDKWHSMMSFTSSLNIQDFLFYLEGKRNSSQKLLLLEFTMKNRRRINLGMLEANMISERLLQMPVFLCVCFH